MSTTEIINKRGLEALGRFYSKYRALVISNDDKEYLNRLKVLVPSVDNTFTEWAYPSSQYGSPDTGFKHITPSPGEIVWVEFENGDPLYPIWSYHGWASNECPEELKNPNTFGFKTKSGIKVIIDDENQTVDLSIDSLEESKIHISIIDSNININTLGVINLNGNNQGIVLTDILTDKLNSLEKELNSLKQSLKSASSVVTPGDGGSKPLSVLLSWANKAIKVTNKKELENKKVKQ